VNGARDYGWWRGSPGLDEHNRAVLAGIGYSDAEIRALEITGVLADTPPA